MHPDKSGVNAGNFCGTAGFHWIFSAVLVSFICLVQLAAMASLLVGRAGFALATPIALLTSFAGGFWLMRRQKLSGNAVFLLTALLLLVLVLSAALSAFFFDLSWDGQWYHQTGIVHIASDWNPLTDPMHSFVPHEELWERHYAKGPWYFAAAVYRATGHIEWGKAYNWLLLAASFSAVFAATLEAGLRRIHAASIAVLVVLNPVVMSEVMTYLVDAAMIASLVIAVAALITCLHRPSLPATTAGVAAVIVTVNAKFTGLVFLGFALVAAGLWCGLRRRDVFWRAAGVTVGALFLAVCVWGWNPYVTNTIYRQQPFYPLLGSAQFPSLDQQGKEPNERSETPKNLVGRNRFMRFFYATFGRPGNQPYVKGRDASLMWPFTARLDDLYAYKYHETRVAGFGPFFSAGLLFSLALMAISMSRAGEQRWLLALAMAATAASLLVSHQLWWARYGPQMWLLPLWPLIFTLRFSVQRWRTVAASSVLCLFVLNAMIVAYVRLDWETRATLRLRAQLRELHDSHLLYDVRTLYHADAWKVRFAEAGVEVRDVGKEKLPGGKKFVNVVEGYPMATMYRAAAVQPSDRAH